MQAVSKEVAYTALDPVLCLITAFSWGGTRILKGNFIIPEAGRGGAAFTINPGKVSRIILIRHSNMAKH